MLSFELSKFISRARYICIERKEYIALNVHGAKSIVIIV